MTSTLMRGSVRTSAGIAVLTMVLAGCGSSGTGKDIKTVADTPSSASPSAEPALALVDDEESADAGKKTVVEALANDSVTLADGTEAALPDTYEPGELTLSVDSPPSHGTATAVGTKLAYTAADGYGGADEFTYRLEVKEKGKAALSGTAIVRITVAEPTPTPTPTVAPPKTAPKPKVSTEPAVYYDNCDAVRAAGAAPIRSGDPGYASHLDRDGDGVGCEQRSGSGSGGSSTSGGSGGGSGGGSSNTHYANCTAVRAAGAAPIRSGDPGYASHLDRDGDGVGCE